MYINTMIEEGQAHDRFEVEQHMKKEAPLQILKRLLRGARTIKQIQQDILSRATHSSPFENRAQEDLELEALRLVEDQY